MATERSGLHVLVEGDLPHETMAKIELAVRRAVVSELANIDLGPGYRISPLPNDEKALRLPRLPRPPGPLGIWIERELEGELEAGS